MENVLYWSLYMCMTTCMGKSMNILSNSHVTYIRVSNTCNRQIVKKVEYIVNHYLIRQCMKSCDLGNCSDASIFHVCMRASMLLYISFVDNWCMRDCTKVNHVSNVCITCICVYIITIVCEIEAKSMDHRQVANFWS